MGLYDDDNAAVTTGDLALRDYWRAKFNDMMLDQALKSKQSEGAIGYALIGAIQLLDELLKTYPNHEDLKRWKQKAVTIQGKIGPNFSRSDSFTANCVWNQHSYQEAYVGYHCGQLFGQQNNWPEARDCFRTAAQKLEFLQDKVDLWPAENAAWVKEKKAEVERLRDEAGKKK
jgi:tetratricopeptide (TPR) repeat protein